MSENGVPRPPGPNWVVGFCADCSDWMPAKHLAGVGAQCLICRSGRIRPARTEMEVNMANRKEQQLAKSLQVP